MPHRSEAEPGKTTVLVVDDEEAFHSIIARHLPECRLIHAYSGWQSLQALARHHVDVVLLDLNLPDTNGLKVLDQIRADRDDVEIIIVTAHSGLRNAVEAVKKGAFDFLAKTYESYKQLPEHIARALKHRRHRREQTEAKSQRQWLRDAFALMEQSQSEEMQTIVGLARQIADTPLTVLLEGESGVGKEVMARYLHALSGREESPFVAVNLSAIPSQLLESHLFGHVKGAFTGADRAREGKFELADGGTLFLDEIAELDLTSQAKILRVLQEREMERVGASEPTPIDVRIIAASNKSLEVEVAEGRFREDLYHRLNVVRVHIPPLRRRREDLPGIIRLLVARHVTTLQRDPPSFSSEALEVLAAYDWPGNVRELENLMMRLVAIHPGQEITADDIPPEYCLPNLNRLANELAKRTHERHGGRLYFLARDQFERYLVRLMVRRHSGNKHAAARALGIGISTVKEKLKEDGGSGDEPPDES